MKYDINLPSVNTNICNLGFTFTPYLCSCVHIDNTTFKAFKSIKGVSGEYKLSNSLKSIYCILVRPNFEYDSDTQLYRTFRQLMLVNNFSGFSKKF